MWGQYSIEGVMLKLKIGKREDTYLTGEFPSSFLLIPFLFLSLFLSLSFSFLFFPFLDFFGWAPSQQIRGVNSGDQGGEVALRG